MAKTPDFDIDAAHRYFAADCFNKAWDLIETSARTEADDRLMVALNQASLFHWLCRPDCTDRNRSIGYWQAARIHALLGHAEEARRAAETCLAFSGALEPFYVGYAHEALARAALVGGERSAAASHLDQAEAHAGKVARKDDRARLEADLAELRAALT